jgi:hypothetical protein
MARPASPAGVFRLCLVLLVGLATSGRLFAIGEPLDYFLPSGTAYDSRVPTPEQFFGFKVGEWHLRNDQVVAYARAVAAAAPERMRIEEMGRSHELRPLLLITVSSAPHLRDLERLRQQHLDLLDPEKAGKLDLGSMPAVVSLGYSVHGNEPSTINAVPVVLYHLAAARGAEIEAMLSQLIILIEPVRNPDGSDRFAQWANMHRGRNPSADPSTREHLEAWPRSRVNHYWFDANRDWLPLVHPEARARAEVFHRWRPNVLTDHHEMGTNNTFFFQPGVPTRNNPLTPSGVTPLTAKIADFHARAFDARGLLYYSEQGFDDFYPGKGSTYPDVHGSVGILFEQGSSRGHVQESDNGELTFAFTIRNQVLTSFSTLAAAQALRRELLELQRSFTPKTLALARQSRVKAHVFSDGGDPVRGAALVDLLLRHRIEVRSLAKTLEVGGRTFLPDSAWVVPVEQPQYRLLTEIFGRRTEFTDSTFYDVSAWSVPLAFNLPTAEVEAVPASGPALQQAPTPVGRVVGGSSTYAYLFSWEPYFAPRALHRLQREDIRVKGLTSPIDVVLADGSRQTFGPGAILVPVGQQPEQAAKIAAIVETIAREDAVTVHALRTGLTPGGVDLGSPSFVTLPRAKVALVTGEGVDVYEAGEAWHALDVQAGVSVSMLETPLLSRVDLSRYTTIVMVDGLYETISDTAVDALRRWVRAGGTLIVQGRAGEWAAKKELFKAEYERSAPDGAHAVRGASPTSAPVASPASAPRSTSDGSAATPSPVRRQPYGRMDDLEALKLVSGSIFSTRLDVTHPLGYGYRADEGSTETDWPVFRTTMLRLKPSRSPYESVAVYAKDPLLAGFVSEQNLRALSGTAAVVAQPVGQGVVVAMTESPNFRGYWLGGTKLFMNAVFYGEAIRGVRTWSGSEDNN